MYWFFCAAFPLYKWSMDIRGQVLLIFLLYSKQFIFHHWLVKPQYEIFTKWQLGNKYVVLHSWWCVLECFRTCFLVNLVSLLTGILNHFQPLYLKILIEGPSHPFFFPVVLIKCWQAWITAIETSTALGPNKFTSYDIKLYVCSENVIIGYCILSDDVWFILLFFVKEKEMLLVLTCLLSYKLIVLLCYLYVANCPTRLTVLKMSKLSLWSTLLSCSCSQLQNSWRQVFKV